MKVVRILSRILVGVLFMFSGFIKGVDPWGSAYKFKEYFEALGMEFLAPYALQISILLIAGEFIVGFCIMFNLKIKIASWLSLLLMLIFLPLTLWLAVSNKVSDCGCFGDAVKLTNWETFYKNVIILIPTLLIFIQRNRIKSIFSCAKQWLFAGVGAIIICGIMWYSYAHLPLIDFLPYKKGANLKALMTVPEDAPKDVYEQFIKLNDTSTGKDIEVTVSAYTDDSTYWGAGTKYKYISISEARLVKEGAKPAIHDFTLNNSKGENLLDSVLHFKDYTFLFIAKKVEEANTKNINNINELARFAIENKFIFMGVTSSIKAQSDSFVVATKAPYEFYTCDETTLKTMIRSNPGLFLLKDGIVLGKWHYNDIPTLEEFKKEFSIK